MKTKPLVLLCPAVPKLGFIFIIENYTGMESEGTSGLGVVKNSPETAGKYVCTYICKCFRKWAYKNNPYD